MTYKTQRIYILSIIVLLSFNCTKKIASNTDVKINQPEVLIDKPYLILISLDGFRWDYVKRFQPPHLSKFVEEGVQAESLIPCFPSKTFPNHYSIATGMYPDNHELLDNSFFDTERNALYRISDRSKVKDGSWYGGTPIWVQAKKTGLTTASFFFVGSEADIQGIQPDYFIDYDGSIKNKDRIDQVLEWLEMPANKRPQLITMYFSDMDDAGHSFGPNDDKKISEALIRLDADLGILFSGIKKTGLPINVMIVSDHGMLDIPIDQYIPIEKIENDDLYRVVNNGAIVHIYPKTDANMEDIYNRLKSMENHFSVFRTKETPQFENTPHHKNWGAIQVIPDKGWYFTSQRYIGLKKSAGKKISGEHFMQMDQHLKKTL